MGLGLVLQRPDLTPKSEDRFSSRQAYLLGRCRLKKQMQDRLLQQEEAQKMTIL